MHLPFARYALAVLLGAMTALAFAKAPQQTQQAPAAYEPSVGQKGKDVVWVPTPQVVVDKMLDMAKVTASDYVMDLGSGDGRLVITAAKRGARALGIEYNPDMVALARRNAAQAGVAGRAKFMKADLFDIDFSEATVLTMFLLPDLNLKLRPKLLRLKPGKRIVSNSFGMGKWQPDATARLDPEDGCKVSFCTAFLWIIPAQVAGTYDIAQGKLELKQEFQQLSGLLRADGKTLAVEGEMRGEQMTLNFGGQNYAGRLDGKRLELRLMQ